MNQPQKRNNPPSSKLTYSTSEDAIAALIKQHGPSSNSWTYTDPKGSPVGVVVRFDFPNGDKLIRPVSLHKSKWVCSGMPEPRPLYALPALANARTIYVVEGEKSADAAIEYGFIATTSSHGSKSASKTSWSPLCGTDLVIFPDNDTAGEQYAEEVSKLAFQAGAKSVRIVRLLDHWDVLPEGGDIADVLELEGGDTAVVQAAIEKLVEQAEIELPPTPNGPPPFKPFPVDTLPEPLRSLVTEGSRAIGCDPSMIALPALAVAAVAIGNSRAIKIKPGWIERATIWAVVVARSGSAKSPAMKLAVEPLRDVQKMVSKENELAQKDFEVDEQIYNRENRRWEKSNNQDPPPSKPDTPVCNRFVVSDTTIEALAPILKDNPRGVLVLRDELGAWIKSFGQYKGGAGGDCESWLSIFDSGPIMVDRKTGTRHLSIPAAQVSVCGTIQPGAFDLALGEAHFENGLAARLLIAMPPAPCPLYSERSISDSTLTAWSKTIDTLLALKPGADDDDDAHPIGISMTPDAKDLWVEIHDELARRVEIAEDRLAPALSKLRAYSARFALIFHLVSEAGRRIALGPPSRIGIDSVRAAVTLTSWFADETERAYAILGSDAEDQELLQLVRLIENKGGSISTKKLQDAKRAKYQKSADAKAALDDLVSNGWGRWEQSPRGLKGGRPTERFVLHDQRDTAKRETPLGAKKTGVSRFAVQRTTNPTPRTLQAMG